MKNLIILGASGSIGGQTLDIVRKNKDLYNVIGVSVGRDLSKAQAIIDEFMPKCVCFRFESDIDKINYNGNTYYGDDGLLKIISYPYLEEEIWVINALVGTVGLEPTVCAITHKRDVCLANKETLVMAGDIINNLVLEYGVKLYPIDSEHSAIWQCLQGEMKEDVRNLIITASGGSFRDKSRSELENVTVADALAHPNWKMGPKITIDSATMVNKGFEVIEAHHLFHIPYSQIKTILHRQSIVHSLVEFNDGSVKAMLGTADMRIPILYSLAYPKHVKFNDSLDLVSVGKLQFEELSTDRYPCLAYAYYVGEKGGVYPSIFHAANEAAVSLFLDGKISFLMIEDIIREYIYKEYRNEFTIDSILELNRQIQKEIKNKYGVE